LPDKAPTYSPLTLQKYILQSAAAGYCLRIDDAYVKDNGKEKSETGGDINDENDRFSTTV
jgi:hypothetical protein